MKRISVTILVASILTLLVVAPVVADAGHIYGIVFMDQDGNGMWGNEPGLADVPVHFVSGDTHVILHSAWNDNEGWDGEVDMYCSYFKEGHLDIPKGCNGTFGLTPAAGWWDVYIDVPDGCQLTTPGSASNPYRAEALPNDTPWTDGTEWLEFGLQCTIGGVQQPAYSAQHVFRKVDSLLSGPYKAIMMK